MMKVPPKKSGALTSSSKKGKQHSVGNEDLVQDMSDMKLANRRKGKKPAKNELVETESVTVYSEQNNAVSNEDSAVAASNSGDESLGNMSKEEKRELDHQVQESDSSEDEVAPRNTVGNVPLKFYEDEKHIGYDISGKKLTKKERQNKLDSYLASADDAKNWRKIYDEYNDEDVELTKEETKLIKNILKGKGPHPEFDPYAPYVDWFKWEDSIHPLSNAPEPKRRFVPSKWEAKKIVRYVRAIRKGLIKTETEVEKPRFYQLWEDDLLQGDKNKYLSYITPPKPKLPGHEESYNPSLEYIPTEEEINSYLLMDEEDRPNFIPKGFENFRSIPAYESAVKEAFERCMDLYLCPRVRRKRINIDPEILKPKLPNRKDLRPYPEIFCFEYKGHSGAVLSISLDASGHYMASGSSDGSVRIWEVETTRCVKVWEIGTSVKCVSWNPSSDLPLVAVAAGRDVYVLNTGLGNEEVQGKIGELLHVEVTDTAESPGAIVSWVRDEVLDGIKLIHPKTVSSVAWHRRGEYFSTLTPNGDSKAVLVHRLSTKLSQKLGFKLRGLAVASVFHPSRSIMFIATENDVRVYDLIKAKLIRKLETGLREASSIAVHPSGDNLIVGSKEGKVCWFDLDLSSKPYKILRCHSKDVNAVAFHRSYPLFASCSEDRTAQIFHGMVYDDLNTNPLIVPLEILRGHKKEVMDCKFHPRQPWLFTASADSSIRLYCH